MKNQVITIFSIFLFANLSAQNNFNIYINEFLSSNVSINADIVDFDDYSDWIELYNDEDHDVDISGYYLTDDPDNPFRYQIPANTLLETKGFIRFWADGYDEMPGRTYWRPWPDQNNARIYFTTKYFHLNFKLSRAGENIFLFAPDGSLVDSVSFGLQQRDVSMGRKPDGSANWMYFSEPTPEAANSTTGTLNIQFAESPDIFPESGFYSGNQEIAINSDSAGSVIKYTLDGSKPGSSSESYVSAFNISETAVIRSRIFRNDMLPGSIVNRTCFLDENISLPVISIITPPDALWDEKFGIYDNKMKDREIPVAFELFNTDGKPVISLNAGLSLTGQASLFYPQTSFTITSRERYGTDEINYQVFPQRELNAFKALYLRNSGVPDHRSTFFRDALQHTLVINKIDIDCQAYQPSVVFLNGKYWGIYNIRDKINDDYIASLHNLNPEDIDLLEYESSRVPTVVNGSADNYNLLYEYAETTDLSVEENYRFIEKWIDMDEYLNYQICEIYYDNVFWPDQNIRMWRERKEDGKWRWILFDTDYGFGMPSQFSTGYTNNTLRFATSSATGFNAPGWSTLIFRKLLFNEEFKIKFIQRFASYMNSIFYPDAVIAVIDSLRDQLSQEMPRHIDRWKDGETYYGNPIPSYGAWLSNVEVLKNFARNRPDYQRQHIIDYFNLSGTSVFNLVIKDHGMGSVQINEVEIADTSYSGIYFKDVPVELKAIPKVGHRFVRWEGTETDTVNPVKVIIPGDSLTMTAVFDTVFINIMPSVVSSDTILGKEDSPYYATGDIIVDSNTTLTIAKGVEILMPEKASIIIYGRLLIEGTPESPVLIGPNEHSASWGAICFVNSTDSSVISNLKITGATRGHDFALYKAAISGYNADFSLRNVTIENSGSPVFVQYGNVFISGCKLYTDVVGDLINVKYAESATVENCDLMGNDRYDSDAIDYDHLSNGIIRSNRIYNIYGFNSDAIDLGEEAKDILVENNIIYNISDKGISIGSGSTVNIKRNIIANCGQGIGIKDNGSYGYIEHNTFYANQYGIACFEKNIGRGGGRADIVSCIFANNRSAAVFTDKLSKTTISFSLSNTGALEGIHNIKGDPLFLNNLRLAEYSPAINSGNPTLPNDPDGSPPDMGAYPFDQQNQNNLIINEIHYNPADGMANQFVEIINAGLSTVNVKDYQLTGDIGYVFPDETIDAGEIFLVALEMGVYQGQGYKVFQWDDGLLSNGPGTIILQDDMGDTIDFVNYNSRYWWPREPDGQGPSLELHHTKLENMVSNSWRSSYSNGGTPGKSNSSVRLTGIFINEFLASDSTVNVDEYGENGDWIEFYNSTDKPVNMGGLYITDDLDNPYKSQIPMYAPELTTVPAKGFILFWADGQPEQGVLHLGFRLSADGEQIGLTQMSDNQTIFIDSLTYSNQTTDISYGRYIDGADNWYKFEMATPGQSNVMPVLLPEEYLPEMITLYQNYPNPFSLKTVISYHIPANVEVKLDVYDLTGRKIATLADEQQQAGRHEIEWNAEGIRPGIYLCELKAGQNRKIVKMVLLK
jgi:hypothetical protein